MAKQLLAETSLTESEIASAVDFTDTSHLIKVFLSELGVTPSSYRKRET
jgi:AraC-like DNA-binding protein